MRKIVGPGLRRDFGRLCKALVIPWVLAVSLLPVGALRADDDAATAAAVQSAREVMDEFMSTFNARDVPAWADTLLFPHVRVASGNVVVHPDKNEFVSNTDLNRFAELNNWQRSAWDSVEVVQAGADKVHFKVTFSRYNPAGEKYATFNSLYILQRVAGRWGIRARSSFAP